MTRIVYKRIAGENTYSYRHFDVPLDSQGLVFVRGLNLDDGGFLGAGKSSLFEALAVVQMGKGGKSTNLADMVNHTAGAGMQTRLWLDVDGEDRRIVLSQKHPRKGSGTQVINPNTGQNIVPSGQHAHKYIREKVVHTSWTTFFHLTYLAQRMTNVLLTGTDAQRKHQITEMFDLDVYDRMAKHVDGLMRLAETDLRQLDILEEELRQVTAVLSDNPSQERLSKRLRIRERKLESKRVMLDAAVDDLREKESLRQAAEERRSYLQEVRELWEGSPSIQKDIETPTSCTKKYVAGIRKELQIARDGYSDLKSMVSTLDQRDILQAQLDKLDKKKFNAREVNEELIDVKSRLTHLQNIELPQAEARQEILQEMRRLELPDADLEESKSALDRLKEEKTLLTAGIDDDKLQLDGDICPTCKRPFNRTLEEIGDVEASLREKRNKLGSVSQQIHRHEKAVAALELYNELNSRLSGITTKRKTTAIQGEINKLISEERQLMEQLDSGQRRAAILNQLKSMPKGDSSKLRKKRRSAKVRVERLEKKLDSAQAIYDRVKRLRKMKKVTRKEANRGLKKAKQLIGTLTDDVTSLSQKVAVTNNQLQTVTDASSRKARLDRELGKVRELVEQHACYKALKVAFGQKGLKHDRLHAIMREAAERTVPLYTDILWPNRTVTLELEPTENSIRFQLNRRGGHGTSSRAISGGESHKAGLAFLFGLRDLKEIYTGYSTNILILDEPFSHLDPQGKLALLKVLNMLKSKFRSIFVVDHSTGVANSEIWDQVWWAVRKDHESQLFRDRLPSKYLQIARRYEEELHQ